MVGATGLPCVGTLCIDRSLPTALRIHPMPPRPQIAVSLSSAQPRQTRPGSATGEDTSLRVQARSRKRRSSDGF